ncbi:hypothetical protein [Desertimonas flava]|uniref:hypothetical protein n=1 Tax=Desertimonas flava TaxID=2064846 RepID=UPI0013C4BC8E|nr:hypothetical protein [Desertimonas flava]
MEATNPPRLPRRPRRRWPVGVAVTLGAIVGAGALTSASAPPDAPTASTVAPTAEAVIDTAAPDGATETSAPPACVVGGGDTAPTDAGSEPAPATTSTVAPTTAAPTTAAPTTIAPSSSAAPTIDVPLPAASPPADGSVPTPPPGSVTPDQQIVLGRDGIGLGRFCDDADTVIAAVTGVLGEPSDDTGWSDPLAVSSCAGTEVRRVTWGSLDLYFGDTSRFAEGVRHFFGYVYGNRDSLEVTPQGLATPEGIGVGSTVQYLLANYPDAQVFPGEEGIADPAFFVDENLGGFLTDHAADGVVTVLFGGEDCGV